MALVGRNDPCPCGSGRKYKRCCIEREAELRRRQELTPELFALGSLLPVLRPLDPRVEEWAAGATELDREAVGAGLGLLSADERARILRCAVEHYAEAWTGPAEEYGDEAEAERLLLTGALVGSTRECRGPHPELLAELDCCPDLAGDPVGALGEVLSCAELWSLPETVAAAVSVDPARVGSTRSLAVELAAAAQDLWTEDHDRRLRFLLGRVLRREPHPEYPRVSAALLAACAALEHDEEARLHVGTQMLIEAIPAAEAVLAAAA